MDNYKIINTHTNEIIKALNDLGYVWTPKKFDEQDCLLKAHWILAEQSGAITYASGTMIDSPIDFKEITLAKLGDLVVLHRNDPKDGNYSLFISDSQGELNLYKTSDDVFYVFSHQLKGWDKSRAVSIKTEGLKAIPVTLEPKEQGLISGADALRALADGKEVEANNIDFGYWIDARNLSVTDFFDDIHTFRLKPRTIKLEIEIPAPFEPKEGERYWRISFGNVFGYDDFVMGDSNTFKSVEVMFGAWRTEEEIKQVVAALRGIKG